METCQNLVKTFQKFFRGSTKNYDIVKHEQIFQSWSLRTIDMSRQKIAGAPASPNGILVNWKRPRRVQKAEASLGLSVMPNCQ